ncbi:MAG: replication protein [Tenericutes bacterium]|nr:replication protein [Mycoplasmatota bacterium]
MDYRSRNWILTCNYLNSEPVSDEDMLKSILDIGSIAYTAFQLEKGDLGTLHHQIYLHFSTAKSFQSIKKGFPLAHIERMRGSSDQAIEYCTKNDTRQNEPVTWGEFPEQGKRNDWIDIYNMIKEGSPLSEIRYRYPSQYIRNRNKIVSVKQEILEEQFGHQIRNLDVTYMYDVTGKGKTRYILEKYGYENVFRISNYKNPFDTYKGEDVIVFEEFREDIPIGAMLHYLDIYPIRLPARYEDRVACYTKAYIVTNWSFERQYSKIKREHAETYNAWKRRIHFIGNLAEVKEYEKKDDCVYEFVF